MTNILLEKKGLIAVATINRPKALNALNSEVLTDLDELVSTVKADADIRALVITGSGEKAFVAGADIGEMSTLTKEGGEALRCENLGNAAAHRTGAEYCYFHDSSSYLNFYMNCLIIRRCACQLTYLF